HEQPDRAAWGRVHHTVRSCARVVPELLLSAPALDVLGSSARSRSRLRPQLLRPSMFQIDVHLGADELTAALRTEAAAGLSADPKQLSPKWFYDDRGSQLFDAITRLPEYYPTRCERAILEARADEIAARSNATTLVELGSGTSEKTRLLLDALQRHGTLDRF